MRENAWATSCPPYSHTKCAKEVKAIGAARFTQLRAGQAGMRLKPLVTVANRFDHQPSHSRHARGGQVVDDGKGLLADHAVEDPALLALSDARYWAKICCSTRAVSSGVSSRWSSLATSAASPVCGSSPNCCCSWRLSSSLSSDRCLADQTLQAVAGCPVECHG